MASLKDLKNRIKSVKNTQKITKAMKMVAAAKLRRAKEAAEAARPYAERMEAMLSSLASGVAGQENLPALMAGTGKDNTHLIIVATSDRGLCGGFNSSIVRATKRKIAELKAAGKEVKLYFIGRKGFEQLQAEHGKRAIGRISDVGKKRLQYNEAEKIAADVVAKFEAGEFDACTVVYNKFHSAISQEVTFQQLIPLPVKAEGDAINHQPSTINTPYEYEPEEEVIIATLLPRNLGVQIYRALLENAASEQGARMTAMDNATRNAGDMIKRLNLVYNRTRQAAITKELIEIISGAEAV